MKDNAFGVQEYPIFCIWITGLSGAGKTTISTMLELEFKKLKLQCVLLDGDKLRCGINKDLGMTKKDRSENIRRAGEIAKLFFESGIIPICSFISPYIKDREDVRKLFPAGKFIEVYLNTPLSVCENRDVKGLYKKARVGLISGFTGVDSPYEPPHNPEMVIDTQFFGIQECVDQVVEFFKMKNFMVAE